MFLNYYDSYMTNTIAFFNFSKTKFAIICAVILFLSALVYGFSPQLIALMLERQLSNYGIASNSRIEYPNSTQLKLATGYFNIDSAALKVQIKVTDLSIEYDLVDLLLKQKITAIHIAKLEVQLHSTDAQPQRAAASKIQLLSLLPAALLSSVDFNQLKVQRLLFSWQKQPQQKISVEANLLLTPQQLSLQGDYFENGTRLATLQSVFDAHNQFTINGELVATPNTENTPDSAPYFKFQMRGDAKISADKLNISASQTLDFKQFRFRSFWLPKAFTHSQQQQIASLDAQLQLDHKLSMAHSGANFDHWFKQLQINSQFKIEVAQNQINLPLGQQSVTASALTLNSSGTINWNNQQLAVVLQPATSLLLHDFNSFDARSAQFKLSLQSALALNFDSRYQIKNIDAFDVTVDATPWSTPVGSINHRPLLINIQQLDLQKPQLAVDFQLPKLTLDNSQARQPLPFGQLETAINGHFSLHNNGVELRLDKDLSLLIKQLRSTAVTVRNSANTEPDKALYFTEALKINIDSALKLSVDLTDNSLKVTDTALTLQPGQWRSPVGAITHNTIAVQLSDIDLAKKSVQLSFDAAQIQLQAKQLPFKQALLKVAGSLQLSTERIDISLQKKLQLQLKNISTAQLSSKALNISSAKDIQLTIPLVAAGADLAQLQISPIHLHLWGSELIGQGQKFSYRFADLSLKKLQLAPLRVQLSSKVRSLKLRNNKLLQNINFSSFATLTDKHYRASYQIEHSDLPLQIKGKIRSDAKFRQISGDWQLNPLALAGNLKKLAGLLNLPWPTDLQILNGNYLHSGQFKLHKNKLEAQVQHQLTELTLKQADTVARGININSDSQYKNKRLTQSGTVNIAEINSGIAITDISSDFSLNNLLTGNRSLLLENTQGKLLQGNFSLERFSTTLDPLQGSSQISFSNLPLNNVLALEQNPSLTGSGSLQGKLPFHLDAGQLYIVDGQIKATDKGYIRYSATDSIAAMAKTNAGLKMALNILEDFYYEVLSIKLNYYPDGKLVLENQLAGNNPNWQQGYPIKFSINVEENLLSLLKTLQFSSDLEKKLQQQIQKSTQ
ncbi:MAG: hypothetical protein OFPI_26690 [Osedax symbiont Rs2]|nr:MAG: hypothetical protein OFPI_26690 [Osedax symbiont Rs2]